MTEMRKERLITLLEQAIKKLEVSTKLLNENELHHKVWQAASDVEYALFLMSLERESGDDSWKEYWKKIANKEMSSLLADARDMLTEANEKIKSDQKDAYLKTWIARIYILNIQKRLEKTGRKSNNP